MTWTTYILRSATRSKRRSFLTAASVGMSIFLLVTLLTLLRELTTPVETSASVRRLVVRHRAGLTNDLPARYMDTLKQMPELQYVTPLTWFGGIYIDAANFFPRFAVDPNNIFDVLPELSIDPEQLAVFKRQKNAAVIGEKLVADYGLKVGDQMRIVGDIYPVTLELDIVGICKLDAFEGLDNRVFFNQQYLNDLLGSSDRVGTVWVVVRDEKQIPQVVEAIDSRFANTEAETLTQSEKEFQLGFIAMIGNLKVLIGSILVVVVASLFVVAAGTISMTVRERTREIAVMKALGLGRWLVFSLIVAESVAISMLGGAAGAFGAKGLFDAMDVPQLTNGFLFKFEVTDQSLAFALLVALSIGLFSCLLPALGAARMTVLDGLRSIE